MQEGAKLNFKDCLKMEFRLSQRFAEDEDFTEGVRAMLVDKDKKPLWKPSELENVKQSKIDYYFTHLPSEKELEIIK